MTDTPRRFYIAAEDSRATFEDCEWVNRGSEMYLPGPRRTTQIDDPYSENPFHCGMKRFARPAHFQIGRKSKPPLKDAYTHYITVLSPRAKELLESIDREAFEFMECETTDRGGEPIDGYFAFGIKRAVIEFDLEGSDVEYVWEDNPSLLDHGLKSLKNGFGHIFYLSPLGIPADAHAFHISRLRRDRMIFDDVLVDAWREAGFTGLVFTPLQEPSEAEFAESEWWSDSYQLYWARKRGLI
jgi:hypothetical protein